MTVDPTPGRPAASPAMPTFLAAGSTGLLTTAVRATEWLDGRHQVVALPAYLDPADHRHLLAVLLVDQAREVLDLYHRVALAAQASMVGLHALRQRGRLRQPRAEVADDLVEWERVRDLEPLEAQVNQAEAALARLLAAWRQASAG